MGKYAVRQDLVPSGRNRYYQNRQDIGYLVAQHKGTERLAKKPEDAQPFCSATDVPKTYAVLAFICSYHRKSRSVPQEAGGTGAEVRHS